MGGYFVECGTDMGFPTLHLIDEYLPASLHKRGFVGILNCLIDFFERIVRKLAKVSAEFAQWGFGALHGSGFYDTTDIITKCQAEQKKRAERKRASTGTKLVVAVVI